VTVSELAQFKREGRKLVAVVCWDAATAEVADAAGVEIVSVGDSVVESLDEILVYCAAVRRGVTRALLSCDLPEPNLEAARRVVAAGADLVKVEGVDAVAEIAAADIPCWGQLEEDGGDPVEQARALERAGAVLLDFRHSGPEAGAAVCAAVSVPVLGGLGGGPWLDGRIRAVHRLLGEPVAAYASDVRGGRPVKGD
jgi:3-methyl-2-oxobutanoate hydroxymethyltransferase